LDGRKFNTPISWDNPVEKDSNEPDLLQEMEEKMKNIRKNLKVSQDRKTIYPGTRRVFRYVKVGVFFSECIKKNKFNKIGLLPKVGKNILWDIRNIRKVRAHCIHSSIVSIHESA
jgi:hypothetical protein